MIDPSVLWAGASAVYGAAVMEETYGRMRPVPADRVVQAPDGHVVELAARALRCLDTPGPAKHHFCVYAETARRSQERRVAHESVSTWISRWPPERKKKQ